MEHRIARRRTRVNTLGYQPLPPKLATSAFGVSKHGVCEIVSVHLVMWRWQGWEGREFPHLLLTRTSSHRRGQIEELPGGPAAHTQSVPDTCVLMTGECRPQGP